MSTLDVVQGLLSHIQQNPLCRNTFKVLPVRSEVQGIILCERYPLAVFSVFSVHVHNDTKLTSNDSCSRAHL